MCEVDWGIHINSHPDRAWYIGEFTHVHTFSVRIDLPVRCSESVMSSLTRLIALELLSVSAEAHWLHGSVVVQIPSVYSSMR